MINIKDEIQKIIDWINNGCAFGLIDLRNLNDFKEQHIINSTNIPLNEIHKRIFELPPRGYRISLLYPYTNDTIDESYKKSIELKDFLKNYTVDFISYIDINNQDNYFTTLQNIYQQQHQLNKHSLKRKIDNENINNISKNDDNKIPQQKQIEKKQKKDETTIYIENTNDITEKKEEVKEKEEVEVEEKEEIITDSNEIKIIIEKGSSISRLLWKACSFLESSIDIIETDLSLLMKENHIDKYYALDLACGSGRDAIFLAKRDLPNKVIAVDHDPILLGKIKDGAPRYGISDERISCDQIDLEPVYINPGQVDNDHSNQLETTPPRYTSDELSKLNALEQQLRSLSDSQGGFHLIHVARYLYRPLLPIIANLILPGGFVVFHTFMLPSSGKPKRPRFLLNYNELKERFISSSFDIIQYQETKLEDGRPVQFLLARKQFQQKTNNNE